MEVAEGGEGAGREDGEAVVPEVEDLEAGQGGEDTGLQEKEG